MAHVYTASSQRVGRVEADGRVCDLHATLASCVSQDGRVIGFGTHVAGRVDAQGRLFDAAGQPAGEVRSDGAVFTWLGQYVGDVEMADEMPLGLKAGAAPLLLPLLRS